MTGVSWNHSGLLTLPTMFQYGSILWSVWHVLRGILLTVELLNQYWTSVCWNLFQQLFWLGWGTSSVINDRQFAQPFLSGEEIVWVFGELLQMLLLALPIIAAIETIVGKKAAMPQSRSS